MVNFTIETMTTKETMDKIDLKNGDTFYSQIVNILKRKIETGEIKPGDRLPNLKDSAKQFGVAVVTMRAAITQLVKEGMIYSRPKLGTFVTDYNLENKSNIKKVMESIGIIVPDTRNLFISGIAFGIEKIAKKYGYNVVFSNSEEKLTKEIECIEDLRTKGVKGVLLWLTTERGAKESNKEYFKELQSAKYSFVLIDRFIRDLETDYVVTDNFDGAYKATSHLISLGHKNIVHIADPEVNTTTSTQDRLAGYKRALEDNGIEFNNDYVAVVTENTFDSVIEKLLLVHKPTAFFAVTDYFAIKLIKKLRIEGLNIPEDVSVVGFDNIILANDLHPPLTTVNQRWEKIGEIAARILIRKIENKSRMIRQISLKPNLIIRKSSSIPKQLEQKLVNKPLMGIHLEV